MSVEIALARLEGMILAMKEEQEKNGEFATINCSVIQRYLEKVKKELEK